MDSFLVFYILIHNKFIMIMINKKNYYLYYLVNKKNFIKKTVVVGVPPPVSLLCPKGTHVF